MAGILALDPAAVDLVAGDPEGRGRALLLVWFGFGLLPKVLIAFLIAFFPMVISTAVGLASIEQEKIHLARSMGLGAAATFFKIRLPNALPSIFAGLKISITLAVVGAVVGEFVGGDAGLGYLLMVANGSMDTPLLFAGLIGLTIQGVVLYTLVEWAEYLAIPRRAATATTALHACPGLKGQSRTRPQCLSIADLARPLLFKLSPDLSHAVGRFALAAAGCRGGSLPQSARSRSTMPG